MHCECTIVLRGKSVLIVLELLYPLEPVSLYPANSDQSLVINSAFSICCLLHVAALSPQQTLDVHSCHA